MKRKKLFCEISPLTYKISVYKCILLRKFQDKNKRTNFANIKSDKPLDFLVYSHNSLIRRTLGNVNAELQNNKAVNLAIAAPKVDKILIKPNEVFSFWHLVGSCNAKKGYKEGLTIKKGTPSQDMGGGMCQFTNLIHWLVLHSPLDVVEHHHHDGMDLFPDFNRTVPFGVGTSILYNYLDYRVKNNTDKTFQIIVYTTDKYLCGELRCNEKLSVKYHVKCIDEYFCREDDGVSRNNTIVQNCLDVTSGDVLSSKVIKQSHAKVMYDTSNLSIRQ